MVISFDNLRFDVFKSLGISPTEENKAQFKLNVERLLTKFIQKKRPPQLRTSWRQTFQADTSIYTLNKSVSYIDRILVATYGYKIDAKRESDFDEIVVRSGISSASFPTIWTIIGQNSIGQPKIKVFPTPSVSTYSMEIKAILPANPLQLGFYPEFWRVPLTSGLLFSLCKDKGEKPLYRIDFQQDMKDMMEEEVVEEMIQEIQLDPDYTNMMIEINTLS